MNITHKFRTLKTESKTQSEMKTLKVKRKLLTWKPNIEREVKI